MNPEYTFGEILGRMKQESPGSCKKYKNR